MSNRGRSQNCQNLNFLHIFVALLQEAHFPKGIRMKSFQQWYKSNFHRKSCTQDIIQHSILWEQWNTHNHALTWKRKIGINWNVGNKLFVFISSDPCHKKMSLESLNIPLIKEWGRMSSSIASPRRGKVKNLPSYLPSFSQFFPDFFPFFSRILIFGKFFRCQGVLCPPYPFPPLATLLRMRKCSSLAHLRLTDWLHQWWKRYPLLRCTSVHLINREWPDN